MGLSANESSLPSPPKPPPADQYPIPAPRTRSGNASIYDRPPDTQIQPFQTPSSASYPLSPIREQPDASTIVGGNLGSGDDEEDEDWRTIGPWVPGPYFGLSPGAYIPPPPASAPSPLPLPRFPETGENEYTTPSQHVQGEIVEGSTINQKLFDFSRGLYPEVWYKFKRFETLSLLNLYNYQHELVQLDKKINDAKGGMNDNDVANLRRLLQEYHDAIKSFKEISQLKRPVMDGRQKTVDLFTTKLNDGHYKSAGDALSMVDLTPEALGVPPDGIRVFLQRRLPPALGYQMQTTSLQTPAYSYPSYDLDTVEGGTTFQTVEERIPPGKRPMALHISSKVDTLARLLIAVVGCAFLIVPMVALAYATSLLLRQLLVVMFVLFFAVVLALGSKATNQELLVATAAYSAVLVVFVGRT